MCIRDSVESLPNQLLGFRRSRLKPNIADLLKKALFATKPFQPELLDIEASSCYGSFSFLTNDCKRGLKRCFGEVFEFGNRQERSFLFQLCKMLE